MAGNNYTLGRGELHFARYKPGTQTPMGERYLGNTPEFNATIQSDNLDHFSSDRGVNEKDASIVLNTNRTGTFITDNIDPDNLSLFFFGEKTSFTSAGATITDEVVPAVEAGLSYQLGMTDTNPVGARMLDVFAAEQAGPPVVPAVNVEVKDSAGATTYDEGTDYSIDMDLGRLTILEGGSITDGSDIKVSYKTKTSTRQRIISGSTPIEGALRYISYNPAGKQFNWYMPYVKLSPNGDYTLKGDQWQQIPFNIEILKKSGLEAIYIDGEPLTS